jgi:hypothetical protein
MRRKNRIKAGKQSSIQTNRRLEDGGSFCILVIRFIEAATSIKPESVEIDTDKYWEETEG